VSTRISTAVSPATRGDAAPLLLIAGGKGGVGKTTLAANLALELCRMGCRTLLVDLDLGLANLGALFGLDPARDLGDALDGRASFEDCLCSGPMGLALLPAASGREDLARGADEVRARLVAGVTELSRQYDLVIGDCPGGIGPDVMALAGSAQHVLIVATPDPAALTDAYGTFKALANWSLNRDRELPTPELFLNQVTGVSEACEIARRLSDTCQRFLARSPRLAGWLPASSGIAASIRAQRPFALGRDLGLERHCLARIAERILFRFKAEPGPGRTSLATSRERFA
jgi:flagellar biosynthesis protein FlhG